MSSEEYLDSLLKSLEENSDSEESSPLIKKIFTDIDDYESEKDMSSFADAVNEEDIFAAESAIGEDDSFPKEFSADLFANSMFEEDGPSGNEILMDLDALSDANIDADNVVDSDAELFIDEELKASLDELLAAADESKTIAEADLDKVSVDDMDVTQYIDSMSELDDSLVEINELLKKSDNNEAVEADDEMMAFLNSFDGEDTQALFTDTEGTDESGADGDAASQPKKRISLFAGRKDKDKKEKKPKTERVSKKAKKAKKTEDIESSTEEGIGADADSGWSAIDFGEIFPEENTENTESVIENIATEEVQFEEQAQKPKKQGVIRRLMEMLTAEEEDAGELLNALNENDEILKELETEDKAKKGKKDKKKKGKKEGKDDVEQAEKVTPEKKKKPKKEKKAKDPLEKEIARSNKVLSKRGFITLIAFCSSLIAIIVALAFFLTDYADKKNARQAFYVGDYQKVYILLYDKVLNDSDALILERVRVILELERNVEVYDFYKRTENEAMALNALLDGVQNYHEIAEVNDFGSGRELANIYQDILQILESDYGVSEDEALALNACEAEEYTIKVYDIVNGTGSKTDAADEQDSSQEIEDVLPEEEGIIELETENEGA